MDLLLSMIADKLCILRRGGREAFHKPILLLTLIDYIEQSNLQENHIQLEEFIFERFKENWTLLVPQIKVGNILRPLYHLQNDSLWRLITKTGEQQREFISSKKKLLKEVAYCQLDDDLFQFISSPIYRPIIKTIILDKYFPNTKQHYLKQNQLPSYILDIEDSILQERFSKKITTTTTTTKYLRYWKFRHYVLSLYNHTCCISHLKVEPDYAIIEACHIQPHCHQGDDSITNGIPLCINLHKAFDEGILSLSDNYQVLMKGKQDFEESPSPYSIRQFEDQQILLPVEEKCYPSLEKIHWHRKKHGF